MFLLSKEWDFSLSYLPSAVHVTEYPAKAFPTACKPQAL